MTHIDDDAELFTLGLLDEDQAAVVRRHSASCQGCRDRVAIAQDVVTALAQAAPQSEPSGALRGRLLRSAGSKSARKPLAIPWIWAAAGIAVGALAACVLLVPPALDERQVAAANDLAFSTIVQSHFLHAAFTPLERGAPAGKVLYEKHGAWLYVIVHAPAAGMHVRLSGPSGTREAGGLNEDGANGTLFVPHAQGFTAIELTAGGEVVARATPAFSR